LAGGSLFLSVGRALLLLMIIVAFARTLRGGQLRFFPARLGLYLSLGAILMLPSVVASADFKTSVFSFVSLNIEYYGLYWIVSSWAKDLSRVRKLVIALVAAAAIFSFIGLVEFATGLRVLDFLPQDASELYGELQTERLGMARVYSTFSHPIFLGAALAMIAPLCVNLFFEVKQSFHRLMVAGAMLLILLCMVLTLSRGPWAAMVLAIGIQFALVWRHNRKYLWLPYAAILGLILVVALMPSALDSVSALWGGLVQRQSSEQSMAITYRLLLIQMALKAVSHYPFSGFGLNLFDQAGLVTYWRGLQIPLQSADNYYIMVLVESGWTGLLGFCMVVFSVLVFGWRAVRKCVVSETRGMSAAMFGGLVGFVFVNFTVGAYRVVQDGYIFWIISALLMSLASIGIESPWPHTDCVRTEDNNGNA
jgi:putative inorganic carbon (HCO3(-)) transporter